MSIPLTSPAAGPHVRELWQSTDAIIPRALAPTRPQQRTARISRGDLARVVRVGGQGNGGPGKATRGHEVAAARPKAVSSIWCPFGSRASTIGRPALSTQDAVPFAAWDEYPAAPRPRVTPVTPRHVQARSSARGPSISAGARRSRCGPYTIDSHQFGGVGSRCIVGRSTLVDSLARLFKNGS